jgi:heme exporter protein A
MRNRRAGVAQDSVEKRAFSRASMNQPEHPAARGFDMAGLAIRRGERLLLRGVALAVEPGQALLLLGPNGIGKTSLLRTLAGLLPRAAGTLRLDGLDPREEPEAYAAKLHHIGHRDGVKTALTGAENLRFWIRLLGGKDSGARGLETFGLTRLADLPAAYLSAGQKRRLALARLAAVERPVWLLDEPAAGLDADGRGCLAEAIAGHRAKGGLVVMASHGELSIPDSRVYRVGESAMGPQ